MWKGRWAAVTAGPQIADLESSTLSLHASSSIEAVELKRILTAASPAPN